MMRKAINSLTRLLLLGFALILSEPLLIPPSQAASQALLVTISDYQDKNIRDLPGTLKDREAMLSFLAQHPLFAGNITDLVNEQATYAAVRDALKNMLNSLGQDDVALFYFSGHGGQFKDASGDEDDQRDEALILYDSLWQEAQRVLLDDELAELYNQMTQGKLIILVDACNSGTLDKGLLVPRGMKPSSMADGTALSETGIRVKSNGYFPVSAKSTDTATESESNHASRYVAIHAAQDHELALVSPLGSYFTQGLVQVLQAKTSDQAGRSPAQLQQAAAAFIAGQVRPPHQVFKPQIRGNPAFFDKGLWVAAKQTPEKPDLWTQFSQLAEKYAHPNFQLNVDLGTTIPIGESYTLQLQLPIAGYVSIVALDKGSDQPVILYPNRFVPKEIKHAAGELILPPAAHALIWGYDALAPPSLTRIVAIVSSRKPLGLFQDQQSKGLINNDIIFALLEPQVLESSISRATDAGARIAAKRIDINIVQP